MTQVQPLTLCLAKLHTTDLSPSILLIPLLTFPRLKPTVIQWPAAVSSPISARRKLNPSLAGSPHPSGRPTVTPTLVSSANWWKLHLIPLPRLLIKILSRSGLSTEPWRTSLVTGHQLAGTLFTCVLKAELLERQLPSWTKVWQVSWVEVLRKLFFGNT